MRTSIVKFFAGSGIRLAILSMLLLGMAGVCMAQASAAPAPPAAPAAVAPQAQPVAQPAQARAPAAPAPRGTQEGIKVHGHWTIEVRNPDGKLVSHTEFENSLVQPTGASDLVAMLFGYGAPGGYLVEVGGGGTAGPCALVNGFNTCLLIGSLISPMPAGFGDFYTACGGTSFVSTAGQSFQTSAAGPCFPLKVSTNNPSTGFPTGLAFSGTAVASAANPITNVILNAIICPISLPSGVTPGSGATSPNACAQGQGIAAVLTSATVGPVTISAAGQLISVDVQISFM
jgi:hypothetical protein